MYTRQSLLTVYNLSDNIYRDKAISERFRDIKKEYSVTRRKQIMCVWHSILLLSTLLLNNLDACSPIILEKVHVQ